MIESETWKHPLSGIALAVLSGVAYGISPIATRALVDFHFDLNTYATAISIGLFGSIGFVLYSLAFQRTADGLKERVASRLSRIEAQAGRRMSRGTGVLATIGSTAPFVGLFGTVWGIMNSFIGISESQTTNLAIVAPGIAEALLATAIGLVAAIPAVVIYNVFARSITGYRQLLADASAGVERLVSRDVDFATVPAARAAAE